MIEYNSILEIYTSGTGYGSMINRDKNAAKNIYLLSRTAINNETRPLYLLRKTINHNHTINKEKDDYESNEHFKCKRRKYKK